MSLMFLACCSSPTIIVERIGKLTVKAYVSPKQGNAPLTIYFQATTMWEDGLSVPIDFYDWSVNGKTVANFSGGSFVIESSGSYEVCVKVGTAGFGIEAEDCERVSVS